MFAPIRNEIVLKTHQSLPLHQPGNFDMFPRHHLSLAARLVFFNPAMVHFKPQNNHFRIGNAGALQGLGASHLLIYSKSGLIYLPLPILSLCNIEVYNFSLPLQGPNSKSRCGQASPGRGFQNF